MLPHENHWKYWNVLVQVQRLQRQVADRRKRWKMAVFPPHTRCFRHGNGHFSHRWNMAVFATYLAVCDMDKVPLR